MIEPSNEHYGQFMNKPNISYILLFPWYFKWSITVKLLQINIQMLHQIN